MQYREIGKSGVIGSAIALGTWAIGGGGFWDGRDDDAQAIKTIQLAVENGITLIDTAPGYGEGKSERLIGEALCGYDRKKLTLSTKCGLIWWGDQGGYMHTLDGKKYFRNLEPYSMRQEVEMSLTRLKTDYLDVYFTHWPSLPSYPTPIARTMQGLMDLKKEGLIRAIGASNVSLPEIREYTENGQLDVIQPPYSMLNRQIEGETLDFCMAHHISVFAYSPLEQGLLTGRITMDYEPKEGTYRKDYLSWYQKEKRIRVIRMLEGWKDLTEKYECTMSQLVIAWTIAQPGLTAALCGARKIDHIAENVKAGAFTLAQEDLSRMRREVTELTSAQ